MGAETLRVVAGPGTGKVLDLEGELELGREVDGQGMLAGDELASRRHARIRRGAGGEVVVEDLGSTNGTFVNGVRIDGPRTLRAGDVVRVGETSLELRGSPDAPVRDAGGGEQSPLRGARARAPIGRPSVLRAGLPPTLKGLVFPSIGLLIVQVIVGYEWLLSGLTKLVRGGFPQGLGDELAEESQDAFGWYRSLLEAVVIPNGTAFGYLIELTELLVGVVLIVTAFLWLFRWETLRRREREAMLLAIVVACGAAITMNVGFYLASGDPLPFLLARSPFDEGVGLDVILPLLELVLGGVAGWTLVALRRSRSRPRAVDGRPPPHIVVAGGGFAGVAAVKELERRAGSDVRVTLVSDANYLLYTPLLPGAASGSLEPSTVAVPLREEVRSADVLRARVVGCDPDDRCLEFEPLGLPERPGRDTTAPERVERLRYDHLVVALGSVSRPSDIPGLARHAIGFKTLEEATALRNWVVGTLERAEALEAPDARVPYLTYVFVGGGYAGLEGLASLQAFADRALEVYPRSRVQGMRWILVQSGERVLPETPPALAEFAARRLAKRGVEILTGTRLLEVGPDSVRLSSGEVVRTKTVVWTAGVVAHPATERLGFPLDERGRVRVDECLRAVGRSNVWAVGDAAAVADPAAGGRQPCPPTAQHATRQGRLVGANVAAALEARPPAPYLYQARGLFVDLGARAAVTEVFGVRVRGFPAWLLGRSYHAVRMPGAARKLRLVLSWGLGGLSRPSVADLGKVGHPRTLFGEYAGQSAGGTRLTDVERLLSDR